MTASSRLRRGCSKARVFDLHERLKDGAKIRTVPVLGSASAKSNLLHRFIDGPVGSIEPYFGDRRTISRDILFLFRIGSLICQILSFAMTCNALFNSHVA
jgi:hypothetical protein